MINKKLKGGLATILFLVVTIIAIVIWPKSDEIINTSQPHKVVVKYELGAKEMELDDYIAGAILNYSKWFDYDNMNPEMIKLLAVVIRTKAAFTMQSLQIIEAEKLPINYVGYNDLIIKYGSNAKEKIDFIKDNVYATNGIILEKNSSFVDFEIDMETIVKEINQGKTFDVILVEKYQEFTMSISFL